MLQAMPEWFIADSARNGLNWAEMYLGPDEVEPAKPRDVDEFQEYGPLRAGHRLTVLGIADTDDLYGVIVACHKGRQHLDFPLADLAAVDEASPNAQPIQDYRVWFANR